VAFLETSHGTLRLASSIPCNAPDLPSQAISATVLDVGIQGLERPGTPTTLVKTFFTCCCTVILGFFFPPSGAHADDCYGSGVDSFQWSVKLYTVHQTLAKGIRRVFLGSSELLLRRPLLKTASVSESTTHNYWSFTNTDSLSEMLPLLDEPKYWSFYESGWHLKLAKAPRNN
jgi:hypothetical protein